MLIKNYQGKALVKCGLALGGAITNSLLAEIMRQEESIEFVGAEGNMLTVYTDGSMMNDFCTYVYIEEWDIYQSNNLEKLEQVIKITEIERQEFFQLSEIKPLFEDKDYYMSLDVVQNNTLRNLIKDFPIRFWDLPNSVEEVEHLFPETYIEEEDVPYCLSIRKEKNGDILISSTIVE